MKKKIITKEEKLAAIKNKMADVVYENDVDDLTTNRYLNPVMIGDVLDWIVDNVEAKERYFTDKYEYATSKEFLNILHYRDEMRKPIEDQNDECIDFVYSLLW